MGKYRLFTKKLGPKACFERERQREGQIEADRPRQTETKAEIQGPMQRETEAQKD